MRFIVLTFTVIVLAPAGVLQAADAPPAASKPNILLIITDQQHAGMLSCAGNPYLKTPNLDSLARTGARFERAYCGNPVCVPSRFCMLSGTMPSRIGMETNGEIGNEVPQEILDDAMGAVFRRAGYQTVYGGKTHVPGGGKKGRSSATGLTASRRTSARSWPRRAPRSCAASTNGRSCWSRRSSTRTTSVTWPFALGRPAARRARARRRRR